MTRRDINRFFLELSRRFNGQATVMVTGAAAGTLFGNPRASRDIDFAIRLRRRSPQRWGALEAAISQAMAQTRIDVNYAEDIDRWGMISLLDYARRTTRYRRFGTIEVRVLDPLDWAIGKLTRYLEFDQRDVAAALRRRRIPWTLAVEVWGKALRASPRSLAQFDFRRHVEHFLQTYGRTLWGPSFDTQRAITRFHRAAGVKLL